MDKVIKTIYKEGKIIKVDEDYIYSILWNAKANNLLNQKDIGDREKENFKHTLFKIKAFNDNHAINKIEWFINNKTDKFMSLINFELVDENNNLIKSYHF